VLARALYGDPGLRPSEDLDLLVHAHDLDGVEPILADFGYSIDGRTRWNSELPLLHHRYVHAGGLPAIEVHWRIHWYEAAFSGAMLDRAQSDGEGVPRPVAADELAALLLFYARDGFAGLRLAADIAQWWDTRGAALAPGEVEQVAEEYPALRRALIVAAWQARRLVGAPPAEVLADRSGLSAAGLRAARGADWRVAGSDRQIRAAGQFADVMLAPADGRGAAVRRQLIVSPSEMRARVGLPDHGARPQVARAVGSHALRLGRRWALALWSTRGGRDRGAPPG
jgi:hypothetical protein